MTAKWKSPIKGWGTKEVLAGDRLPYASLVDDNVVLLRDGSVMLSLTVPGLAFETADSDELNAHVAAREVLLRSSLDARFVLYHHVIRRRVEVELDGRFDDPLSAHIDARWRECVRISTSTPPLAASGLVTVSMPAIVLLSTVSEFAVTLPSRPPPWR
jgi:type IV secretion system protein VirB4